MLQTSNAFVAVEESVPAANAVCYDPFASLFVPLSNTQIVRREEYSDAFSVLPK